MQDVYKQLARTLDRIPSGFPETQSGAELKLLAKLFTPEEAALACQLTIEPQSARSIAQQTGRDEQLTLTILKGMTEKGIIEDENEKGNLSFKLTPFIVGFSERQNARVDKEFAHLFEAYYQEAFHKIMSVKPSVHRIIPIEKNIPLNIEVMPYERASIFIENAQSWGVMPCICRVQKRLIGQGCKHSEENCLVFSQNANAFDSSDVIRAIDKEKALEILVDSGNEGLVHSTRNVQKGVTYICNCCTCSCGILRGLAEYGELNAVGRSDFYASVDETLCSACGLCIDHCQFKALKLRDDENVCGVNRARCYGCGLCVSACPMEALSLVQKTSAEIDPPPVTQAEWREKRTQARTDTHV
ncbi:MAG TPA: 4Fe-4S binding protein [Candidatus Deferrimicrobium sp.]|nr:4Fe-4S binding protein [Candidatus Deferrimicrobium sp.]